MSLDASVVQAAGRTEHETNQQATGWAGTGRESAWPALPAYGADDAAAPGTGPGYELIGKVAVMHEGRVKPLDTVAREEVKQIYGRETIKLRDPNEEIEKIVDPENYARKTASRGKAENRGDTSGRSLAGR